MQTYNALASAKYNMSERKPWTSDEDQLLRDLLEDGEGVMNEKLKWVQVAEKLTQTGTARTGKQCRQRWHNQLKPGIENQREWSLAEQQTLFRVQEQLGNHWAIIAKELPGRTDNNIKNYFYSTLRKAMRKVNSYVLQHRKGPYRNVKEFKQFTLNKILAVAEHKYENKINLRSSGVEFDAREIKKLLVDLQRDQSIVPTSERHPLFEHTIQRILEFNRNCKRRKGKRKDADDDDNSEEMIQTSLYDRTKNHIEENPEELKKEQKPEMPKEFTAILEPAEPEKKTEESKRPESEVAVSQYILNSGFVGRSNSSYQKESQILFSSSFREYQGGQTDHNPLAESHNYAGNCERGGFLSSMPIFEKKQTNRSEFGLQFWREDSFQGQPLTFMMDWSGNIGNMMDDAQMRLSMSLGASAFLQNKTGNQIDKPQKEPTTK